MSEAHIRHLLRQDDFLNHLLSSLEGPSRDELWQGLRNDPYIAQAAELALRVEDAEQVMSSFAAVVALGLMRRNQDYLTLAARVDHLSFSLEDRYEAFMPRSQETGRERTADDDGP